MQYQINCPYFKSVILNGVPYNGCMKLKQLLNSDNVHQFCGGDKCQIPIINKQEIKK
jgi:hypothetical protein